MEVGKVCIEGQDWANHAAGFNARYGTSRRGHSGATWFLGLQTGVDGR